MGYDIENRLTSAGGPTYSAMLKKLDDQGGKCAQCGEPKTVDETNGHHVDRHADGGKTDDKNHAELCKDCHDKLHEADAPPPPPPPPPPQ